MSSLGDAARTRARREHLLLATRQRARRLRRRSASTGNSLHRAGRTRPCAAHAGARTAAAPTGCPSPRGAGTGCATRARTRGPILAMACDDLPVMSWPSNTTRPARGCTTPAIAGASDDFPAPLAPRTAVTDPARHRERHAEQRARLAVRDLQVGDLEQRADRCSRVDSVRVRRRRRSSSVGPRGGRRSRRPAPRGWCGSRRACPR